MFKAFSKKLLKEIKRYRAIERASSLKKKIVKKCNTKAVKQLNTKIFFGAYTTFHLRSNFEHSLYSLLLKTFSS